MMHQCINDAFMKSAFCILYWTLRDTLSSLVDRRHLIDLMLVDRMFKSRFDSLEYERENGYRHPHYIIVTYWKHSGEEKSKQRILYEEHPCTGI
jgi:hypothetical protein